MASSPPSIQESLYPTLTCFGCGHANPKGFHLRSYADGSVVVASFLPWPEHDNGYGFLNGGIITTVLDCHTAAAVMLEAHTRAFRDPDGAPAGYVTAGFDVRFLRPTPRDRAVSLTARLVSVGEDEMICEGELAADDKVRATMRAQWKRFRKRA